MVVGNKLGLAGIVVAAIGAFSGCAQPLKYDHNILFNNGGTLYFNGDYQRDFNDGSFYQHKEDGFEIGNLPNGARIVYRNGEPECDGIELVDALKIPHVKWIFDHYGKKGFLVSLVNVPHGGASKPKPKPKPTKKGSRLDQFKVNKKK